MIRIRITSTRPKSLDLQSQGNEILPLFAHARDVSHTITRYVTLFRLTSRPNRTMFCKTNHLLSPSHGIPLVQNREMTVNPKPSQERTSALLRSTFATP